MPLVNIAENAPGETSQYIFIGAVVYTVCTLLLLLFLFLCLIKSIAMNFWVCAHCSKDEREKIQKRAGEEKKQKKNK